MSATRGPALSFGVRLLLALFAVMPAALVAAIVLHLIPPEGLTPLAQRPAWATWALVVAWPVMAIALAALARRESQLWRAGLGLAAGLLAAAGVAGLRHGHAPLGAMTLSLLGQAGVTTALAFALGEPRPERPRASASSRDGAERSTAPDRPSRGRLILKHFTRHAGFWIAGILMVESFRLAHVVAVDPQRGVGMVGMVLTFFLVLPAVSLMAWMRATPLFLLAIGAVAFTVLAAVSGVPQAGVAAALTAGLFARVWRQPSDASGAANAEDAEEQLA